MRLRLYAGRSCWVLVPEFLPPPAEAAIYAPLEFRGFIEDIDGDREELEHLRHALRRSNFAVVPHDVVERLWPGGVPVARPR